MQTDNYSFFSIIFSSHSLLCAFAKFRKAIFIFIMFILLSSVRMEQLGSHFTDFHEILYVRVFRKSVEKILFLLKSDKKNDTLHEDLCTFMIMSR